MRSEEEILSQVLGKSGPANKFLRNSKSVIVGLFDREGRLLYANEGLKYFIMASAMSETPSLVLVNPTWKKLSQADHIGGIFKGKLTLGDMLEKSFTFDAEVFNLNPEILVFGEADAIELFEQNGQLSILNQQVNNLQRQLIKEKRAMERLVSELDELNQVKNRYIGMVAHDLRNPIGLAQSFAQLLLDQYQENTQEDNLSQLAIIERSCSFSINLISEMLDVSKIEAGIINLKSGLYNYIEFCRSVIYINRIFAKKKNQEVIFSSDLESIMLTFDQNKIEQVLNNLIGNAIKFSQPDTKITVKISQSGSHVITEVKDEGQGMPAEEVKTIFEPFNSGSAKATGGEKSYGLGLAIVKRIIDAHHGSINVASKPGEGLSFSFMLPL